MCCFRASKFAPEGQFRHRNVRVGLLSSSKCILLVVLVVRLPVVVQLREANARQLNVLIKYTGPSEIYIGRDQPHRVSPHSGGLPCTSEFFCWPLRSLTIRMRSQYTPIYYRKSPVPSRELYTILLAHTYNSGCHPTMCPRTPRRTHILLTNYPQPPYDTLHGS